MLTQLNSKLIVTGHTGECVVDGSYQNYVSIVAVRKYGQIVQITGQFKAGLTEGWREIPITFAYTPFSNTPITINGLSTYKDVSTCISFRYLTNGNFYGYVSTNLNGTIGFSVIYITEK